MVQVKTLGNCPNCGAPIRGDECAYCGTAFTKRNKGIDIYDTNGNYILTLLENGIITSNEARRMCRLASQEIYYKDELTRKLQFL